MRRALVGVALAVSARPGALAGQLQGPVPPMRVASGELSFEGYATVGDFIGTTKTVRGEMTGGERLETVRGWVEAPVKSLETGDRKRDRDLNKSMESDTYPTMRFELTGVAPQRVHADTLAVHLRGRLTIHGVTRDVVLPARLLPHGERLRVQSGFPLDLGDYKIGGLSKMMGLLRMQEEIQVRVDLTFAPL